MKTFEDFLEISVPQKENVLKYTQLLCNALEYDYMNHEDEETKFVIEEKRKYYHIIHETSTGSRSSHAFVDKKTGEVYKSASFKSPAKGVRFNLLNDESRESMLESLNWHGTYLYVK